MLFLCFGNRHHCQFFFSLWVCRYSVPVLLYFSGGSGRRSVVLDVGYVHKSTKHNCTKRLSKKQNVADAQDRIREAEFLRGTPQVPPGGCELLVFVENCTRTSTLWVEKVDFRWLWAQKVFFFLSSHFSVLRQVPSTFLLHTYSIQSFPLPVSGFVRICFF